MTTALFSLSLFCRHAMRLYVKFRLTIAVTSSFWGVLALPLLALRIMVQLRCFGSLVRCLDSVRRVIRCLLSSGLRPYARIKAVIISMGPVCVSIPFVACWETFSGVVMLIPHVHHPNMRCLCYLYVMMWEVRMKRYVPTPRSCIKAYTARRVVGK